MFKLISLVLLISTSVFAAGEAALVYMEIPVGARATAMGESFVSVADDPFTLMYNPAGLGQYPLNNGFEDIELDTSYVLYDAVFKYDNNPEILMLLTNKGLLEYNNGVIKNTTDVLLSDDEGVEDVVGRWTTDDTKTDEYLTEVIELNNLADIDYEETPIFEVSVPYSIITEEKVKILEKAPDGTLMLIADTAIVIQTQNGWDKLAREQGLRGKIKEIGFKNDELWVMTDKAMFYIDNYKLIDQTTAFEVFTSKSLRTFWDEFSGFDFVEDSTIWFKSKEFGVLEYKMGNISNEHEVATKPKKDYTILNIIDAKVYDSVNYKKENLNGHTVYTIDSIMYKEAFLPKVIDTAKIDSSLAVVDSTQDSNAVKEVKINQELIANIKAIKYDSLFADIKKVKEFLNREDSIYAFAKTFALEQSYAKDFTSYGQVFEGNEVSDIIDLDSITIVLSEGAYYTKRGTNWKRFKMANLKKGKFIGSSTSKVYIQTAGELLKYNYKINQWTVELEKESIAGAFSEKGFFLASNKDLSIYKKTGVSFALDYQSLLPELNDNGDMFIVSVPVIIPNIPLGALGVSVNYVSYGKSVGTDENGNQIGTIRPLDLNIGVHWGVNVTNNHSLGLGFKGYYSKLAGGSVGNQETSPAVGWLADIGYLYSGQHVNVGVSLMNFGDKVFYVDDNQKDNPPSVAHVGISKKFQFKSFSIMPTVDFSRSLWEDVSNVTIDSLSTGTITEEDSRLVREIKTISPHGGFEFIYSNLLALRVGYLYDGTGERNYMPIGGGVKLHDIAAFRDLNIDFSYILNGFGDPFDDGGESVNANSFKISISAKLK